MGSSELDSRVYATSHQYEPLRVPSGWNDGEKRLIVQLTEILDDLYRRWGRLRFEDFGKSFRNRIEDDEGNISELVLNTEGLVAAVNNNRLEFNQYGLTIKNAAGDVVMRQDIATGDLTIAGLIRALGGVIGGFTITPEGLTNGDLIQLMSSGLIKLGGMEMDNRDHPYFRFVYDGIEAFRIAEGNVDINNTLNIGGRVYITSLPTTSQPPNLYWSPTDKLLYRSTWTPSSGGPGGAVTVTLSKYTASVGESITAYASVTGVTATSYTYTVYRNGVTYTSGTTANAYFTFTPNAVGTYAVTVSANTSGGTLTGTSPTATVGGATTNMTLVVNVSPTSASVGANLIWSVTPYGVTGSITSLTFEIYNPYGSVVKSGSNPGDAYYAANSAGQWYARFTATDALGTASATGGYVNVSSGGGTPTSGTTAGTNVIMRSGPSVNASHVVTIGTAGTRVAIRGSLTPDSSGGSIPWWPVRWEYSMEYYEGYIRSDLLYV